MAHHPTGPSAFTPWATPRPRNLQRASVQALGAYALAVLAQSQSLLAEAHAILSHVEREQQRISEELNAIESGHAWHG